MKLILQILHTSAFYIILAVTFMVGTTITLPFSLFTRKRYRPFQFAAKVWSRMLIFLSGARVTVSGLENIPGSGPLIFASNHQGAADILLLLAYLPRYFRFIIKKELFKIPFFGRYLRLAGYISIDREVALASYKSLGSAAQVLESRECILIFPEGTRSRTGDVGMFKRGSLMMALQTGATVVPIGISGSFKMMRRGSFLINLVPISLKVGKPISLVKYKGATLAKINYEEELNKLRDTIISLVG
jgi:1-acyl-sn-glycerol-3-phosphate acyltransferase